MDETTIEPPLANLMVTGRNLLMAGHQPNHSLVRHSSPAKGAIVTAATLSTTRGLFVRTDFMSCSAENGNSMDESSAGCLRPARAAVQRGKAAGRISSVHRTPSESPFIGPATTSLRRPHLTLICRRGRASRTGRPVSVLRNQGAGGGIRTRDGVPRPCVTGKGGRTNPSACPRRASLRRPGPRA